ncbi:MAG: protein kinase [Planctomycetia bacterium]|nr:protein kinase [Planctomycetia bacterium]
MSVRFKAQTEPIPGYTLIDRLGSGGFGEVWRCEAPGGIFKAVKIIHGDLHSNDNDLVRYAEQELKALKRVKQVRHPYLLALDRYDIVDGRLLIVMELADCNLWDRFRVCRDQHLPGIPRDELLQYMAEAAEVLDLMNDQFQLQHLDIKPQNLFLLYNHVKVADFGQVKDLQGLMAQVTGGITPVYAAPETFDGVITRYCDQYSLACVYQELLTGIRPFDGSSMGQLLMQHLSLPPNLDPSPALDRPALARALAKRADDRWPTVTAFVRALASSGLAGNVVGSGRIGQQTSVISAPTGRIERPPERVVPPVEPTPQFDPLNDFSSLASEPTARSSPEISLPVFTPAPPESTGPGPLRPTVVIGLGHTGQRVIQRLRYELTERYGPAELIPAIRTLFVDTDPDAFTSAAKARPRDRLAALDSEDMFPAKLNRAAHYMKPRLNGRTLTEGWFDPQLLCALPRSSQTLGVRQFGRLAFLDHYRPLMGKVQMELETALAPESLLLTEARTGLPRRTNRPRVYIVTSLAGGTGGGMFLDMAFAVRTRLKRMGYDSPDIIGLFVLPPADPALTLPQALGNTYAALTELNHYSRPETTFTAHYDERQGVVSDKDAPFTRCYLLPGSAGVATSPPAPGVSGQPRRTPSAIPVPGVRGRSAGSGVLTAPGSRIIAMPTVQRTPDPAAINAALKPYADAADRIRLDLFSSLGRTADESLIATGFTLTDSPAQPLPRSSVTITTFGLTTFDWPRSEVVGRTSVAIGRNVLKRWAAPDLKRAREVIPAQAVARWTQLGLEPEMILSRLQRAADAAVNGSLDEVFTSITEPLVPRGWLARLPESGPMTIALDRLHKLLGSPTSTIKRPPTAIEEAVVRAGEEAESAFANQLRALAPILVDDPQFRLAGTEELYRQFIATTDRLIDRFLQSAADAETRALDAYEWLTVAAHPQKGIRKPTAAELTDALRQYPRARFQALTFRQMMTLYQALRDVLNARVTDVSVTRQRVATAAAVEDRPLDLPLSLRRLMPTGCATIAEAVDRFVQSVTDADLTEIDRRIQSVLEPEGGGLFKVCQGTAAGTDGVIGLVFEEARTYLDARLGDVGLASMFAERFRTPQQAERAIEQAHQEAEPSWIGPGPWTSAEITVVGCPAGESGESLRELARRAIPVAGLPISESRDDLTIYREWPSVPLAALPHLGPAGVAAYHALPEAIQCTPHARVDVTNWVNVDGN